MSKNEKKPTDIRSEIELWSQEMTENSRKEKEDSEEYR